MTIINLAKPYWLNKLNDKNKVIFRKIIRNEEMEEKLPNLNSVSVVAHGIPIDAQQGPLEVGCAPHGC
jgi:hypothetical protein